MDQNPRTPTGLAALLLLAVACSEGPPAGSPPEPARPNLLVVTIDTLRADHLGCYGYFRDTSPTIDALAAESVFFERCISPMATTLPSHTSLLTGTYPIEHGVLANVADGGLHFTAAPGLRSLAQVAREAGYHTAAFVSSPPLHESTGIGAGFDTFDDVEIPKRPARETNARVFPWIDERLAEPFLLWVHYFDPHRPRRPPPPFQKMFTTDEALQRDLARKGAAASLRISDRRTAVATTEVNKYDGEVRFADDELRRLFDRLRERGVWDRTTVVVTSDHGEALCQHGMTGHGYVYDEHLHVPLLLRVPGVAARRVRQPMSLVDVVPTLLGLIGPTALDGILAQMSGRDVLAADHPAAAVFSQRPARERDGRSGPTYTLTGSTWKYVFEPDVGHRLYRLEDDPHELVERIEEFPDTAAALEQELLARVARFERRAAELFPDAPERRPVDPQVLEQLRALGYVD